MHSNGTGRNEFYMFSYSIFIFIVFRNQCADSLANWELISAGLTVWMDVPLFVKEYYVKNRLSIPTFRFINS